MRENYFHSSIVARLGVACSRLDQGCFMLEGFDEKLKDEQQLHQQKLFFSPNPQNFFVNSSVKCSMASTAITKVRSENLFAIKRSAFLSPSSMNKSTVIMGPLS